MLCINSPSTDVYFNLAAEEYLLKNHSGNIFMIWQGKNAVVLGKHQNVRAEIDVRLAGEKQISIARRYSGGGTVYHDLGNINLTFIENQDKIDFSKYIKSIIGFLSAIGIEANADERLGINIDRLKISGSAQCIYKKRVLYHCTLLYSSNLELLNASLNGEPENRIKEPENKQVYTVKSVKSKVTNISDHLKNSPDIGKFKEKLLGFYLGNDPGSRLYQFGKDEEENINRLKTGKYMTPEWIFGRHEKGLI